MLKVIVLSLVLLLILVPLVGPYWMYRPMPRGLCQGQLPDKPNWVSSLVAKDNPHYVKPLPAFDEKTLIACIRSQGLRKPFVWKKGTHWLGYRRTTFFGFTDWFCISEKGEVSSSATIGHSDLGVNRAWVEAIRDCLD